MEKKDQNQKHERAYIPLEEVSERTGVPQVRILNQIRNGDLNGILFQGVNGPTAVLAKEELPHVK